jgi:hypothetical protein
MAHGNWQLALKKKERQTHTHTQTQNHKHKPEGRPLLVVWLLAAATRHPRCALYINAPDPGWGCWGCLDKKAAARSRSRSFLPRNLKCQLVF